MESLGVLIESITCIVTADDVINTKPHPEPYLKAVFKLGIPAENSIVIENAVLGVKSAKAAGCKCYALETTLTGDYLQEADMVFSNHEALYLFLKNKLSH